MKNTILSAIAAIALSASASAQTDSVPSTPATDSVVAQAATSEPVVKTLSPTASTVDSIAAKYTLLPMPESLTIEKIFPAIGSYQLQLAEGDVRAVSITLDQASKGIIWVEGLPEGRFKAYLKKSPATYRIVSQKTESGKQLSEGTLIFDKETNTLNIAFGAAFNETEPAAIFATATDTPAEQPKATSAKAKSKKKVTFYTASKVQPVQDNFIIPSTADIQ